MPYRPIQEGKHHIQYSTTPGETLQPGGLKPGELAVNTADGVMFCGSADGSITSVGGLSDAIADGNTYARKDGSWVDLASAAALQFRQGTNLERLAMTPPPATGEPIYTTDTNRFFIGDGTTTGGRGVVTDSDAYVVCQPGDDLLEKYEAAKALTAPGGSARSSSNRAALIIFPGRYDIGSQTWAIDTDFVDVIGLGSGKWAPSVLIESTATGISFGGEDVRVVGLFAMQSTATAGGAKRFLVNCGGAFFYACNYTFSGALPDVIKGNLVDCQSGYGLPKPFCGLCSGGNMSATASNVFAGTIDGCYVNGRAFSGIVFDGQVLRSVFTEDRPVPPIYGVMQGLVEYCSFPYYSGTLPVASSVDTVVPPAYGASATISNASPAVVTKVSHGLYTGMKVSLATSGALPAGLSTSTTYYVKRTGADTFELSATRNGASINTSSAGSGTHTVEKPAGKDAGWYAYATARGGDFSST